ncbi:MAG TPA: M67 family metallopeptidase [Balneolales bacterium]|nr:M67 family metallopeptidase [Balneolales bacterium]
MELSITQEVQNYMKNHAEEIYNDECCGFLYGKEEEKRVITLAKEVINSKEGDKRRRFKIDPQDYQQAERFAVENDLDLLGVYHSHPDHPARPSETDLRQAVPFFSYIILSVMKGKTDNITSWQLNGNGEFEEEKINILQKQS